MNYHGNKKETLREAAMRFLQEYKLPQPQIQNYGRQAGSGKILQERAQAY